MEMILPELLKAFTFEWAEKYQIEAVVKGPSIQFKETYKMKFTRRGTN